MDIMNDRRLRLCNREITSPGDEIFYCYANISALLPLTIPFKH